MYVIPFQKLPSCETCLKELETTESTSLLLTLKVSRDLNKPCCDVVSLCKIEEKISKKYKG